MNLGEVRSLVRTYLNEGSAAFWSDATLNTLINIAAKKIHILIKNTSRFHFTTRSTFSTVAGSDWYQLPGDCKDVKHVTKIVVSDSNQEMPLYRAPSDNPFPFTDAPLSDNNPFNQDDNPSMYWIMGASIRLIPKPTAAVTIRLYYEARITDLVNASDTPACDSDYHDMVAKWAAIESATKDEKLRGDLLKLFAIREQDLISDVFHRVPAPPQEVEGYMQGIY